MSAGIVSGVMHAFGAVEQVPSAFLNRLQADDAALSEAIAGALRRYHFPLVDTDDNILHATAAADAFTLESGVVFIVGGVIFDTANLSALTYAVPDNSTRFLRAEIADDCGDLEAWTTASGVYADPMVRLRTARVFLTAGSEDDAQGTGGGPSGPSSMRLLKAVKGAAGTLPVITYYANNGLAPDTSVATHEAKDPAHPSDKVGFDNGLALLAGNPTRVKGAIEALANEITGVDGDLAAHLVADPAHAAAKIGFDNGVAGLALASPRVQDALTALDAGSLRWSATQTYTAQCLKLGPADGLLYQWLASSGPGVAGIGAKQPGGTGNEAYWQQLATLKMLSANLSLYVATTGSDSNDGRTASTPFKTIDKAVSYVASSLSLGDYSVTINVAAGVYDGRVLLRPYQAGGGGITIAGAGIGSTILTNTTSAPGSIAANFTDTARSGNYNISGMTINIPDVTDLLSTSFYLSSATVSITNISIVGRSSNSSDRGLVVNKGASLTIQSGCSMTIPNGWALLYCAGNLLINANLTLNGTATYTVVSYGAGTLSRNGVTAPTVTGTVTSTRYYAYSNGIIDTIGGGASYFPGTTAGTTATGGQYA